jgi:sarcosine oxidase, subunit gamma
VTDDATARSPLAHRRADLDAFAAATGGAVSVAEVPFLSQVDVRVAAADAPPHLPRDPNTTRPRPGGSVLWLGPDEWLVTGGPGSAAALLAEHHRMLAAVPHAVVDVSANRAVLDLEGPGARDLVSTGCAIDLHPRMWRAGMCAQTLFARTQVILEQRDDATRVFVRPSFADYLVDRLAASAMDIRA